MPGWLADADLQNAVRDVLAKSPSTTLTPHWQSIVTAANTWAYYQIVDSLTKRGYSLVLISQWDRGFDFQRSIALWRALTELATQQKPGAINKEAIDALDLRPYLDGDPSKGIKPVALTINGVFTEPNTKYGQVTFGEFDTSADSFNPFPPVGCDPRVGQRTRF